MIADEDSDTVRETFRRLCQHGAIFIGMTALLYGTVLLLLGLPDWHLHYLLTIATVPLYSLLSVERAYRTFLLALLLMLTLVFALCTYSTLQFGRSAGFQLILIAMLPAAVVSGRINAKVKWTLVALFSVFLVGLDFVAGTKLIAQGMTPIAAATVRAMNYTVLILATTGMVFQYFRLAVQQNAALMEMAMIDPLTGLYNRRQMILLAQRGIAECRRHGQPFSIVLCDLDHFKMINDTLGHDAGDDVLRRVARELSQGVRSIDSVGRWGGEEFLLLLPQTDLDGALLVADRLRQRLAEHNTKTRITADPPVTATMGVATFRTNETLGKAISRADAALYLGKSGGRNRVVPAKM